MKKRIYLFLSALVVLSIGALIFLFLFANKKIAGKGLQEIASFNDSFLQIDGILYNQRLLENPEQYGEAADSNAYQYNSLLGNFTEYPLHTIRLESTGGTFLYYLVKNEIAPLERKFRGLSFNNTAKTFLYRNDSGEICLVDLEKDTAEPLFGDSAILEHGRYITAMSLSGEFLSEFTRTQIFIHRRESRGTFHIIDTYEIDLNEYRPAHIEYIAWLNEKTLSFRVTGQSGTQRYFLYEASSDTLVNTVTVEAENPRYQGGRISNRYLRVLSDENDRKKAKERNKFLFEYVDIYTKKTFSAEFDEEFSPVEISPQGDYIIGRQNGRFAVYAGGRSVSLSDAAGEGYTVESCFFIHNNVVWVNLIRQTDGTRCAKVFHILI